MLFSVIGDIRRQLAADEVMSMIQRGVSGRVVMSISALCLSLVMYIWGPWCLPPSLLWGLDAIFPPVMNSMSIV